MIEYATTRDRIRVPRDDKPSKGAGDVEYLTWSREEIEKHLAQLGVTSQKRPVIPPAGKRGGVNDERA